MTMNILHITDLGNGKVQIEWKSGSVGTRSCPKPIPFTDPLSVEDRKALRWYLEEYLQFPYGAERFKAERVEKKMKEWGKSIFEQIFAKCDFDPDPRSLYQEAVRAGLENCELCITSEDASFLNIPWELIYDPTQGKGYLAFNLAGLYRHRTGHKIEAPSAVSGDADAPFRILLVIARPYRERDVPLGMVARPMLKVLRAQRQIEVEILRPPTFDELQRRLNDRRGYYNLVHFDGHGEFAQPPDSSLTRFGVSTGAGHLVFENEDGSPHFVSASELGQVLASAHVPLFVLNACQSAIEGAEDPFSSIASQLIATGAKGVVAMSYSVYAITAARFMQRFYEQLISHASLSEAVAAARRMLWTKRDHETSAGKIELLDWMVPVLYQQEYNVVPIPEGIEPREGIDFAKVEDKCPEGRYGFIGRDSDILRIERALRASSCVLITGMSGIGKTELAYGFARWFAETGGCPGGVFVSSFKGGGNIGKVLGDILGYATDLSRLSEEKQRELAIKYLREHPCLLIWDNFETVSGYPEGTEPLATDEERRKLAEFLQALRGGKTRVLITTRKPEERWLGVAYSLIELKGLAYRDAVLLANRILQTVGRKPEDFKDDENYPELLKLLQGHPRAMEVVLPQLRWKTPSAVIEELQHNLEAYPGILDASSEYAFSQMPEEARKHLLLLSLFTSFVNLDILRIFVARCGEVYRAVIGEPPADAGDYEHIMNEAVQNGLISRLQNHIYQLHPSLPPFLRHRFMESAGEGGVKKLDTEFIKFYADFAAQLYEEVRKANHKAVSIVEIEELNFLRALRIAVKTEQWAIAQAIAQTLHEFYEIRGRFREWSALRSSLLDHIGREISIDAPRNLANLWMFLFGEEANEALRENRLDDAEHSHKTIIQYLQKTLPEPEAEPKIAVGYHQLGMIAEERQQFDVAEQWYRKALEIFDKLGLERYAATDYHQLGRIAQKRQQFDVAEQWYRKALEIRERLGLERDAATDYHQLGIIAQKRQQFDVAEQWYRKALEIFDKIGHPPLKVDTLAQFGVLRFQQGRLHESVAWFAKAYGIASAYRMPVVERIKSDLRRLLEAMGREGFVNAWREATGGEEPRIDEIKVKG